MSPPEDRDMRKAKKGNWEEAMKIATVIMDSHQRREATIEDITQAILHFATQAVEGERKRIDRAITALAKAKEKKG